MSPQPTGKTIRVPAGPPPVTGAGAPEGGGSPKTALEAPPILQPVPGTETRRRFWFRIDWDLIACGLHGHELVGTDAAEIREEDAPFAREGDGLRWHRCLRCEAWVPLDPPLEPHREHPPAAEEIALPMRGRRLRDRYILRLIVIDRAIRVIVLSAVTVAIFLFAQHKSSLHHTFVRVLNALQVDSGGSGGFLGDLNHLFKLSTADIYLIGAAVAAYTTILLLEAIGLWHMRRWAEYLTLIETSVFIPIEIYEIISSATPFAAAALVLNLAIVGYLLAAHRLLGLRGGKKAAMARYGADG